MKKLFALLLALTLTVTSLVACNKNDDTETKDPVIRIGYMQGPTGMGMAKLINDNGGKAGNEKYQFVKYANVNDAQSALLAGKIDMACVPTNNAAVMYNKNNAPWQVLALNCLNSLYVLTKDGTTVSSIDDLEGKTIYTISAGTPKVILEHILAEKNINATISTSALIGNETKALAQPSDLASAIIAGAVDIALVPEPVATAAPLQAAAKGNTYTTALDLSDVWDGIAMGCIVANKDFVANNKDTVDAFLAEYKASIEFMSNKANLDTAAQYIVDAEVLGAVGPAKKSLTNLGDAIAYVDGDEMKSILVEFYNNIGVGLTGGKLPDDNFYYKK